MTLEVVVDHYPIEASPLRSVVFPKNSILQIPGVWTELEFEVMGKRVTLDRIEHAILRKEFSEPRIHMALVCAGKGCPPLRGEPYTGDRLDEQFSDQTKRFLAQTDKFRIDRIQGRVYLSPVLDWFGGDFAKGFADGGKFASGTSVEERAVLSFLAAHLEPADREYLATGKYKVVYLGYDWSLNEQAVRKGIS